MEQSLSDLARVLRRRSMERDQTALLNYLCEAGDEFVSRDQIAAEIRWENHEDFVAVLSAFSTRINYTEGITGTPGYEAFIERGDVADEEQLRLRAEAREAIARVDELEDAFE